MAKKKTRRSAKLPTIIRIYRPDRERQLQALQTLLQRKAPTCPTPTDEVSLAASQAEIDDPSASSPSDPGVETDDERE